MCKVAEGNTFLEVLLKNRPSKIVFRYYVNGIYYIAMQEYKG